MKIFRTAAVLGLILIGRALAADGTPPAPGVCHSFSEANAAEKASHPAMRVIELTPRQAQNVVDHSNLGELAQGSKMFVVQVPGEEAIILAVVAGDCVTHAAAIPAAALAEVLGIEI